jgi:hypothetical protein
VPISVNNPCGTDLSPLLLVLVLSKAVLSEAVIEILCAPISDPRGVPRGRRVVD